jgi:excisionase family DNA binding protein
MTLLELRACGRATIRIEECADLLGIGRTLAYSMARTGELPTIRLGRLVFVRVPALLEMLEAPLGDAGRGDCS